jgi:hypothetical protein
MNELMQLPFALPQRFLGNLGYGRVVQAMDSPAMRAHVAELLRKEGIAEPQSPPPGPQRYVALWWESAGDELAWSDGPRGGAGQLDHWSWLEYVHQGAICGWLVEHHVNLDSSDTTATDALVIDNQTLDAYVVRMSLARRRVREQSLGQQTHLWQRATATPRAALRSASRAQWMVPIRKASASLEKRIGATIRAGGISRRLRPPVGRACAWHSMRAASSVRS